MSLNAHEWWMQQSNAVQWSLTLPSMWQVSAGLVISLAAHP